MRILLTGGTGTVGRMAVARLVQHGHQVRVVGRRAESVISGAEYAQCDINDYQRLSTLMEGMEAVVHLAAIANPALGPGHEIMRVNAAGTFNVYHAAAAAGIKRVVQASSINALGYNFGVVDFPLRYFPMDEDHPTFTTDPYSFSKQIVEEIAAYYWRREGISGVSLRLPAVLELDDDKAEEFDWFMRWHAEMVEACQAVLRLPPVDRAARARGLAERFAAMRVARLWEKPYGEQGDWHDPDVLILFGRNIFWATIDARDSAQAIEQGLLADYTGSHPLYVNDSHNATGLDSHMLAEVFFPEVTTWKKPLQGDECLVSIERARALIGFAPEYSVIRLA
jgi:nucleoside-diphosphate-sugar epimerase